jgi:tRNA A37 threonylcarbamoyladenosine biosynthesis protein TsaE
VYSIRTRKKNYNITVILRITELEQTMALTQEELLHLAHWDLNEAQTKRRLLALKINDLLNDIADTLAIVEESEVAKRIIRSRITSIRTALADKTNAEIDAEVTQQIKEAEPTVAQRNTTSKLIMEKNHDR